MERCNIYDINKMTWIRYIILNKQRDYFNYRVNQISNIITKKSYSPKYKRFANHKVLSFPETNDLIRNAILERIPFWAGRYGMSELRTMVHTINKELSLKNELDNEFRVLCNNAGFFPEDVIYANDFTKLMLDAYLHMDLHAIWPQFMEDYFVMQQNNTVKLTRLGFLEPWNINRYADGKAEMTELWTTALEGKKVLVVHPFTDTIRKQYEKRRCQIFSNIMSADRILPEFELLTIKAIQTSAGNRDVRFKTWFDALNYMVEECKRIDFDVAIVGCGAYGFALCREIKDAGKVAIHLGGATQLMFGIMGKRWERKLQGIPNKAWTRPSEQERPSNSHFVEDGCYW